jgi:hypothetical protein
MEESTGWDATRAHYKKLAEDNIKARNVGGSQGRHVSVLAEDLLYLVEQAELGSDWARKVVP